MSRNSKTTKSFAIMTFQGILLFLLFPDTFRIQGILSFLLFLDTFGKSWKIRRLEGWKIGRLEGRKVGKLEGWKVKVIGFVISPSHNPRPSRAPQVRGEACVTVFERLSH